MLPVDLASSAGPSPLSSMPLPESLWDVPSLSNLGPSASASSTPGGVLGTSPSAMGTTPSAVPELASNRPTAPDPLGNSSILCNLLPSLGQVKEPLQAAGIYVGEGQLPVPAKPADKITRWEFVDMAELLPEYWTSLTLKEGTGTGPSSKVCSHGHCNVGS